MKLYTCPYCSAQIDGLLAKPAQEKYRWFEFSRNRLFCPHCKAEVALEKGFQRWGLLVLPAVVLFVREAAFPEPGGTGKLMLYGALCLAVLGIVMLFVTRKLVVLHAPRGTASRATQPRRAPVTKHRNGT